MGKAVVMEQVGVEKSRREGRVKRALVEATKLETKVVAGFVGVEKE